MGPKSKNARQGIATGHHTTKSTASRARPKSKNARQGIATDRRKRRPVVTRGPKSKNARQGIATLLQSLITASKPKSQKQKCPPGHCDC